MPLIEQYTVTLTLEFEVSTTGGIASAIRNALACVDTTEMRDSGSGDRVRKGSVRAGEARVTYA
jgi:hypothetical protein